MQPRRRRQQERHKFSYLIVKNNSFARFARAVFIFGISQTFTLFPRRVLKLPNREITQTRRRRQRERYLKM